MQLRWILSAKRRCVKQLRKISYKVWLVGIIVASFVLINVVGMMRLVSDSEKIRLNADSEKIRLNADGEKIRLNADSETAQQNLPLKTNCNEYDKVLRKPESVKRALRVVDSKRLINDLGSPRPHAAFLLEPKLRVDDDLTRNANWTAVNFLKSAVTNIDRRQVIRETWGSMKFRGGGRIFVVFILGTTTDKNLLETVKKEHKTYGDILLMSSTDSSKLVPEKTIAGMQWASKALPGHWIYSSADDDIALHVPNFARFINSALRNYSKIYPLERKVAEKLPIICLYNFAEKDPPARNVSSKWYMPVEVYPLEFWPPYCRGGWYTIPVFLVAKLYEISRWMPFLHLDDVWITGLMRIKLLASCKSLRNDDLWKAMIAPAPLSIRTDNELFYNKGEDDLSKVIVSHLWGNIEEKDVDVCGKMRELWMLWAKGFD